MDDRSPFSSPHLMNIVALFREVYVVGQQFQLQLLYSQEDILQRLHLASHHTFSMAADFNNKKPPGNTINLYQLY